MVNKNAIVGGEYYVFRDMAHNLISIENTDQGRAIRRLMKTFEIQRMRRIKQNGLCFLVYPSMEHSRFSHSLGCFAVAKKLINDVFHRQPAIAEGMPDSLRLKEDILWAFMISAFLHDVGHLPLSHVFEEYATTRFQRDHSEDKLHEIITLKAIEENTELSTLLDEGFNKDSSFPQGLDFSENKTLKQNIKLLLQKKHPISYLNTLLSGALDIDRLDFVARDTKMAGVSYGLHELDWLVRSLRIIRNPMISAKESQWVIAIDGRKGLTSLVQFLQSRANMYRQVYLHKTVRSAQFMLFNILDRVRHVSKSSDLFFHNDSFKKFLLEFDSCTIHDFLNIDDDDLWCALKCWSKNENDKILKLLCIDFLKRAFFKVIQISSNEVFDILKRHQEIINKKICSRFYDQNIELDDAKYFYSLDKCEFDLIGESDSDDNKRFWIIEKGRYGHILKRIDEYKNEFGLSDSDNKNFYLFTHWKVEQDLRRLVNKIEDRHVGEFNQDTDEPDGYKLLSILGDGAHKVTYLAIPVDSDEKTPVAIKKYKSDSTQWIKDVEIPNTIIQGECHNVSKSKKIITGDTVWLIEELWDGTLSDYVKEQGPIRDLKLLLMIIKDLFYGLNFLQKHNVRHTDIKPDNCGFIRNETGYIFKIGDFGCISTDPEILPENKQSWGSFRTRPPELMQPDKIINMNSDVWALAATIFHICTLEFPFLNKDEISILDKNRDEDRRELVRIKETAYNTLYIQFLESLEDLIPPIIYKCLMPCFKEINNRPSAEDICKVLYGVQLPHANNSYESSKIWELSESIYFSYANNEIIPENVKEEMKLICSNFRELIPKSIFNKFNELCS